MRKQKTIQGNYAYSDCEKFVDAMRELYNVRKVVFEEVASKDDWVIKWRVTVFYKNG